MHSSTPVSYPTMANGSAQTFGPHPSIVAPVSNLHSRMPPPYPAMTLEGTGAGAVHSTVLDSHSTITARSAQVFTAVHPPTTVSQNNLRSRMPPPYPTVSTGVCGVQCTLLDSHSTTATESTQTPTPHSPSTASESSNHHSQTLTPHPTIATKTFLSHSPSTTPSESSQVLAPRLTIATKTLPSYSPTSPTDSIEVSPRPLIATKTIPTHSPTTPSESSEPPAPHPTIATKTLPSDSPSSQHMSVPHVTITSENTGNSGVGNSLTLSPHHTITPETTGVYGVGYSMPDAHPTVTSESTEGSPQPQIENPPPTIASESTGVPEGAHCSHSILHPGIFSESEEMIIHSKKQSIDSLLKDVKGIFKDRVYQLNLMQMNDIERKAVSYL